MIEINLLPKEFRRKGLQFSFGKTGLYAVAGAAGVVVMLLAVTFLQIRQLSQLDENIQRVRQRAAMLQKDIALVDGLQDVKGKINSRMSAVEKLDRSRSVWVRILEDVNRNVPEFVWLVRLDEGAVSSSTDTTAAAASQPDVRRAEIEGYSFTLNALAAFMINMMRSDYFDDVELVSTSESTFEDHTAYNFVVTCNTHFLSDEEARQRIAQAQAGDKAQSSTASHKRLN